MKAILFDMYGTLARIESPTSAYRNLYHSLTQGKISIRDFRQRVMTQSGPDIREWLEELGVDHCALRTWEMTILSELKSITLYEDVEESLTQLSGMFPLYLLSNVAAPFVSPFYQLGLDRWIKQAFFSCEMGLRKPAPAAFEHVLNTLELEPDDVLMVGDSFISDVKGAQVAGMKGLWLNRGGTLNDRGIQTLNQLVGLAESLQGSRGATA
ncbi:HAD family hydrolase [Pontibacter sp. G13]|uniref:HAD family hydrolase n=1 Tax=Pontibacter sp. G13 TaxID=3074898 RepID=UPI00288B02A8|nr:HAD family hydrolase [Pontibacter sp. G13]WNJ17387.1 HAD family hydrolase [Pontibacter sp. G13]